MARLVSGCHSQPDLNPLDFFLWGYMKEEIHRAQPGSIAEVKQLIENFIASITEDLLQRVTGQFVSRIRRCIEANAGVFEYQINHTNRNFKLSSFDWCLFHYPTTKIKKSY